VWLRAARNQVPLRIAYMVGSTTMFAGDNTAVATWYKSGWNR
jgi:hypothetical protein